MDAPARPPLPLFSALLLAALVCAWPAVARAQAAATSDHVYVVADGDTLSRIAERLGVSTRALAERNHLEAPYRLRVGRSLRLPVDVAPTVARSLPVRGEGAHAPTAALGNGRAPANGRGVNGRNWGRPRRPGTVSLVRESNDETMRINLRRVSRVASQRMEHFLRFPDGRHHPIDPRLLRQLALVSDHFGGRRVHVISGFRPFRHGQWTAHSNHNIGHAMDFRIEDVPNRVLRDYCRTFPRTGCGYYPRSVFVHMDVREESTTWVDWSRPGQRPIYGREDHPPDEGGSHGHDAQGAAPANAESADESVEDVAADDSHVRAAAPTDDEHAAGATAGDNGGGDTHGEAGGSAETPAGTQPSGHGEAGATH